MIPLIADRADAAVRTSVTEAGRLAEENWRANAGALAGRAPHVLEAVRTAAVTDLEWVFARDGYLTCFESGERWLAGCSVPLLAARAMLKPLDGSAGVACLLAPAHAGQVRVVLERVQAAHAAVCIVPDVRSLRLMLHCDDFSNEVARGCLWFAAGDDWAGALARLLAETPGLPTPTRFVRMPDADGPTIDRLIDGAQRVFGEANARRNAAVAALRERPILPAERAGATYAAPPRVCVVARSTFRLWDDAGHALWSALAGQPADAMSLAIWTRFDPDDPAGSSPLALATAAAEADVLVAADLSRADAPRLVNERLPWVTWVTTPRVPSFAAAGPNDRLVVVDPAWRDDAIQAGWPALRVSVAGWPEHRGRFRAAAGDPRHLALIADTAPLDAPEALAEFSSHVLLWEQVRRDVLRDPFAVPADVAGFVFARARAAGIAEGTLDVATFVNRLVVPAYQQAVAELLLDAGLPLRLYGAGWPELARFAPHAAGPVRSRDALADAAGDALALVHASPARADHPVDTLGRPVLRSAGTRKDACLRAAGAALSASHVPTTASAADIPPISPATLLAAARS